MTPADPALVPRGRRWLTPLIGILISGGLLYWALQGVDIGTAIEAARAASLPWLVAGVATATATFVVRVPRWQQLLRTDRDAPLAAGTAWHGIAIGFMANNIIPRSGEFLRALVAARLAPVTFTAAFASVAVERIFDGLTITAMLALALFSPAIPADAMVGDALIRDRAVQAGILCLLLLAGAMVVVALPTQAERLARRLIPWPKLADKVTGLMHGVVSGLGAMRSPTRLAAVSAWSLVLWTIGGLSFWMVARGFGIEIGLGGAFLIQGVLAFGVAVPSTPGYVGVFEAVIVGVLSIFGIDKDLAFAYAVTYHVATFFPIVVLGAVSVLRTPISLGDLRQKSA